jgi:hypothetical protein
MCGGDSVAEALAILASDAAELWASSCAAATRGGGPPDFEPARCAVLTR